MTLYSLTTGRDGFTLIGLLVVIATIVILAAIVFPVFAEVNGEGTAEARSPSPCRGPINGLPELVDADMGWGWYYDYGRFPHPSQERPIFRAMAEYGCNTVTIYYNGVADLRRQLNAAEEVGLLDPDFPLVLIGGPVNRFDTWPRVEPDTLAEVRRAVPGLAKYNYFIYTFDEPAVSEEARRQMAAAQEGAHRGGWGQVTAVGGRSVYYYGSVLDLALVRLSGGAAHEGTKEFLESVGSIFGAYEPFPLISWDRSRYIVGLWCWKYKPAIFLQWGYEDHILGLIGEKTDADVFRKSYDAAPYVSGNGTGPGSYGWGWREGVIDYRVLRTLELLVEKQRPAASPAVSEADKWLSRLRCQIVPDWCQRHLPPDERGELIGPPAAYDEIRQMAVDFIEELRELS